MTPFFTSFRIIALCGLLGTVGCAVGPYTGAVYPAAAPVYAAPGYYRPPVVVRPPVYVAPNYYRPPAYVAPVPSYRPHYAPYYRPHVPYRPSYTPSYRPHPHRRW
jgi:hypothetical protein